MLRILLCDLSRLKQGDLLWSAIGVRFDANNPGVWAFHCHILYHLAADMFTVLKYEGVNSGFWQPEKTRSEIVGLEP